MAQLADGWSRADVRPARLLRRPLERQGAAAITRFTEEGQRLLAVLDRQLQTNAYLAGENYTIADIAAYPWMLAATTFLGSVLGPTIEAMPAVKRWLTAVVERDAVKRGLAVPKA
jgi:GSH-dependent disulfide-bond oxidoreductase